MGTQEQVGGGGAVTSDHARDGEPRVTLAAALRQKAREVAPNGFAGATAGAVSRLLTAPLDVAKIRFQLDHGASRRYDSTVLAAMRSIYGEEGLVTLWRGNFPAMILWSAYTAVQFVAYEQLRSADFLHSGYNCNNSSGRQEGELQQGQGEKRRGRGLPPALANFAYGSIAAFTATLATYPLDITRTALAYQGVPKRYKSMSEFLVRTLRETGPRGLYRGAMPTLAMITPQMGVSFAVWEALRDHRPPFMASAAESSAAVTVWWQLGAGAIAGTTGKLAVFPLDTVKKRVQTVVMLERHAAYGVLPKYAGPIHAFKTVLREEGAMALFRGSVPAMWKSGVSTAITYAVYEWVKGSTSAALG